MANRFSSRRRSLQRAVYAVDRLEPRQLLSVDIMLVDSNGDESAVVDHVGQVVTLDVVAVVSAAGGATAGNGVEEIAGTFGSTTTISRSLSGSLTAQNYGAFTAAGSSPGTAMNGSVGSYNAASSAGDFIAKAATMQTTGTVDSTVLEIQVGTVAFTVTNLNGGAATQIQFDGQFNTITAAIWQEAGNTAVLTSTAAGPSNSFTISAPSVIVPPQAFNDTAAAYTHTPTPVSVLTNDVEDSQIDASGIDVVTAPGHGTTSYEMYQGPGLGAGDNKTGVIDYTSDPGYTGPDSFQYTVPDINGLVSNVATVHLNVTTPPLPLAVADTAATNRNAAIGIDVLANDNPPDPGTAISILTTPANGTATATQTAVGYPDGRYTYSVEYSPAPGYIGTDSFTYNYTDASGDTSPAATVTVTISAVPPVALDQTFSAPSNKPTAINVYAGAVENGVGRVNTSSAHVVTQPTHGTVVIDQNGNATYVPTGGYQGTDSFTYTIANSWGDLSNVATDTLTVYKPTIQVNPQTPTTTRQVPVSLDPLPGDQSPYPAVSSSIVIVVPPAHGTATVADDGTITYTSSGDFIGTDVLHYTFADTSGERSAPGIMEIGVYAQPPSSMDFTQSAVSGGTTEIDVIDHITQPGAGLLVPSTVTLTTRPIHGTATPDSNGDVLYTPTAGYVGTDSFEYAISNSFGDVSSGSIATIDVSLPPTPTAATAAPVVVTGSTARIDPTTAVASAVALAATSTAITIAPIGGTAVVQPDGSIVYSARAGFVGTDSLIYTIDDVDGQVSAPVTQTLAVGTTISSVKGASKKLVFVDAAGAKVTVSLNIGSADVSFSGTGTETTVSGITTVTGSPMAISSIVLTNTTNRSTLTIQGSAKSAVTFGNVSDASILGSINAPKAILMGTSSFLSVASVHLLAMSDATFITTGPLKTPIAFNVLTGLDASVSTTQTIKSFVTNSWATDTSASPISAAITAPVIDSLSIGTAFAGTVSANTSAGTLLFRGGLHGAVVSAGSVKRLDVVGDFSNADVHVGSAGSIVVTGTVTSNHSAAISSTGNIGAIAVGSLDSAVISVGVTGPESGQAMTLSTATAADLGSAVLGSLRITGRGNAGIVNSAVFAGTIKIAAVGVIEPDDGGVLQGIAAARYGTIAGRFNGHPLLLGPKQLATQTALAAYLTARKIALGDYDIVVAG